MPKKLQRLFKRERGINFKLRMRLLLNVNIFPVHRGTRYRNVVYRIYIRRLRKFLGQPALDHVFMGQTFGPKI